MARLPDADQSGFPLPRFNFGGSDRAGPRAVLRSRATGRHAWHSGMAQLLFQIANVRERTVPRARSIHSADEVEEHVALDDGRRSHHALGFRVLRLNDGIKTKARPRRGASSAIFFCAVLRA